MSCSLCLNLRSEFANPRESFEGFLHSVNELKNNYGLEELGELEPAGFRLIVRYRCRLCGQYWRLAHPDHGFRGFFEEDQADLLAGVLPRGGADD